MTVQTQTKPFPFPDVEAPPRVRHCLRCKIVRIPDDDPRAYCPECIKAMGVEGKQLAVQKKQGSALDGFVQKVAAEKIDAPHISELCEKVIKQFGGLEAFARFYYAQISEAAADTRTSKKLVLEACKAVINLVALSTQHRASAPDVQQMSPEEIEEELRALVLRYAPMQVEAKNVRVLDDGDGLD